MIECPTCDGQGFLILEGDLGPEDAEVVEDCYRCDGTGELDPEREAEEDRGLRRAERMLD